MPERTDQSRTCTDAPRAPQETVLPVLRSVCVPTEPLRIVQPLVAVKPRPAPPARPLTARPLGHDLPDYEATTTPAASVKPAPAAEYKQPGPLLGRELIFHPEVQGPVDRYDRHAAYDAFGAA